MAELQEYKALKEKRPFFNNGDNESFVINTIEELDRWFEEVHGNENDIASKDATALIYKGMKEAKYKLYTSAQRLWMTEEISQWAKKDFLDLIGDLIENANNIPLINKVFDLFNYSKSAREFPILSLLQHYEVPTPLMDWSYNLNVSFYMATEIANKGLDPKTEIDKYFFVYRISKWQNENELYNIIDFLGENYPAVSEFKKTIEDHDEKSNFIFYISDFESKGMSTNPKKRSKNLMIRINKPYTTTYNQNIIPQEGMFIFNPYPDRPIEELFNPNQEEEGWNLALSPFDCFNIHKDLAEYLRRKIDIRNKINMAFIYPELKNESQRVKNRTLNGLSK